MSASQHAFKANTPPAQQTRRGLHLTHRPRQVDRGVYTIAQVLDRLSMKRRTFFRLRDQGHMPFLEEVKPRLGLLIRYRADLIDSYVANTFNRQVG